MHTFEHNLPTLGKIHLGTILGTTITLDFSFLILVALFVMVNLDSSGAQYALLWIPILFISILFHELAHAAMIGVFGYGPSQIVLQGVGGVTINERRARPWQDLFVSAAGPGASLLLAWIVGLIYYRTPIGHHDPFLIALLPLLQWANIVWCIFNLLPVAPLDGYGIVRNFLRMLVDERTAFSIAIWISIVSGSAIAIFLLVKRQFFPMVLLLWYVRSSYVQWQFFRSIDRTNDQT
jgi:Zn-dependent protease